MAKRWAIPEGQENIALQVAAGLHKKHPTWGPRRVAEETAKMMQLPKYTNAKVVPLADDANKTD
jgi:hypothetical protein